MISAGFDSSGNSISTTCQIVQYSDTERYKSCAISRQCKPPNKRAKKVTVAAITLISLLLTCDASSQERKPTDVRIQAADTLYRGYKAHGLSSAQGGNTVILESDECLARLMDQLKMLPHIAASHVSAIDRNAAAARGVLDFSVVPSDALLDIPNGDWMIAVRCAFCAEPEKKKYVDARFLERKKEGAAALLSVPLILDIKQRLRMVPRFKGFTNQTPYSHVYFKEGSDLQIAYLTTEQFKPALDLFENGCQKKNGEKLAYKKFS